MVAHTVWGVDRNTPFELYWPLIKLDNGGSIYQSARKTYQKILNLIYNGGLRLVLGAFRRSPVESFYAESNDAPAGIRANKLPLQYYDKLKLYSFNPAYEGTFHPRYKEFFLRSEKAIKPFDFRMETINEEAKVDLIKINNAIIPSISFWTIRTSKVILTFCKLHRTKTHPLIFQEELEKIK